MRKNTKFIVAGAAALVIGAGLTTAAVADIPDSTDGTITACRVSGDAGNVRIIDKEEGKTCHSYEDEVSWKAGYVFTPKTYLLTELSTGSQDDLVTDPFNCPAGQKLVSYFNIEKSRFTRPHDDTNWVNDDGATINTNAPLTIEKDANGVVTGVSFRRSASGVDNLVVLTCSP